jgi:transcriptional regulator with XRE-family HTH domain
MSQERLAGRLEVSFGLISQWETGETKLTEERLLQLADALQCEPGDIMSRDPNSPEYKLWRIIEGLPTADKDQALRVIEALTRKTA